MRTPNGSGRDNADVPACFPELPVFGALERLYDRAIGSPPETETCYRSRL